MMAADAITQIIFGIVGTLVGILTLYVTYRYGKCKPSILCLYVQPFGSDKLDVRVAGGRTICNRWNKDCQDRNWERRPEMLRRSIRITHVEEALEEWRGDYPVITPCPIPIGGAYDVGGSS